MTLGHPEPEPSSPATPGPPPEASNRRSLVIILGLAVIIGTVALIAALASGGGTPPKDEAAARKTLQNYIRLAAAGDVTGACKLVTDASYQSAERGPYGSCERFLIDKLSSCADPCSLDKVTIFTMTVQGTYATATWGTDPSATNQSVLVWDSHEGWRIDVS